MRIARRLFVVPLADNDHGKTSIIRALVSQAEAYAYRPPHPQKAPRQLVSPWGRMIDAYVFGRSYQEVEKRPHGSVVGALDANDAGWRGRELIIMPSHVTDIDAPNNNLDDIDQMIEAGQSAGFDVVCANVIYADHNGVFDPTLPPRLPEVLRKRWDERWTIPNKEFEGQDANNPYVKGQLEALGRDLWTWICRALAS